LFDILAEFLAMVFPCLTQPEQDPHKPRPPMVGQVLYLEAEEAGIRSTAIGCYFDDPVHEIFGIASRQWQSFYPFSVGGPVEDVRLTTLPAYGWEPER
jgi:hypothetical protein